ncbi:MAG TPA: response regulator transcription factor [Luteitalea sp.]|nr:response regulator transcription factor [Luteitalea sp.]
MIRVILVDDHALVRQGFRRILEEDPGFSVVGEAGSAQDGVALARQAKPDVVLMDMSMPDANGIHAAREILRDRPETKILVLSMYSDGQYVRSALDAGVSGYILKSALETDLTRAVRAVASGQQYLSPELAHVLIRALKEKQDKPEPPDAFDQLTQREKQVLQLIAHGKSNKEIASLLNLSVNTVAVHRANLMGTLGVHKAAELVLYAVRKGLVLPE